MTTINRRHLLGRTALAGGGLALAGVTTQRSTRLARASASGLAQTNDARFAAEVDAGLAYFRRRAADQVPLVADLLAAVRAGDLPAAQAAYVAARPPYEEIEVLAASFPETDAAIDARPYSIDGGETSVDFKGFHRIEALLYRDEDLDAALPHAEGLVASVRQLATDLDWRDAFSAELHFEGMIALATEVAAKKISSEEETWSDQSLLIFRHNWLGIASQYQPFAAAVASLDTGVASAVEEVSAAALALVEPYFADGVAVTAYSAVGPAARGEIVRASYRLRDALVAAAATLELVSDA